MNKDKELNLFKNKNSKKKKDNLLLNMRKKKNMLYQKMNKDS